MTPLVFVLAAFAAARITRFVTEDELAEPIRGAWWRRFPAGSKTGDLIACPYCIGWWISGAVLAVAMGVGFVELRWRSVLYWPAIAGAQALLNAIDMRLAR